MSVLLLSVIAIYFGYSYMSRELKEQRLQFQQELEEAQALLKQQEETTRTVWLLTSEIEAGHAIKDADLTSVLMPLSEVPDNALFNKEDALGKIAKLSMQANTMLVDSMLFENGKTPDDLRNRQFALIELPTDLQAGDFVDVRINFPGGQDYIVLSKKKVQQLANGVIWMEMNEEEILTMSSAIVDAYINSANIYAVSYVDPYMQEPAEVTYPSNEEVLDLMRADPNIVDRASDWLERQQRQKLETALAAMDSDERREYESGSQNSSSSVSAAASAADGEVGTEADADTGAVSSGGGSSSGLSSSGNASSAAGSDAPASTQAASGGASAAGSEQRDIFTQDVGTSVELNN